MTDGRAGGSTSTGAFSAYDPLPDLIAIVGEDKVVHYMNPAGRALLGELGGERGVIHEGSTTASHLLSILTPDVGAREAILAGLRGVESGADDRFELCLSSEDGGGGERWITLVLVRASFGGEAAAKALLLARDTSEMVRREKALRESEARFRLLTEMTSEPLILTENGVIIDGNPALYELFGYSREELLGKTSESLTAPEHREIVRRYVMSTLEEPYEIECLHKDGTRLPVVIQVKALPYRGRTVRGATFRDMRAQQQAEYALRMNIAQEEKIFAQAAALAELSMPIIPLWKGIIVMPLVGALDGERASQVATALLDGASKSGADTVILDITGVPKIDAEVASAILRAARALRLIGAEAILTGIRAEVAQTLVTLGVDLAGLVTRGTLESGITYAMGRRGA